MSPSTAFARQSDTRTASGFVRTGDTNRRDELEKEFTNCFAASIIASPDFPSLSSLPRIAPPPFSSMGHQHLLDYPRLTRTTWSVGMAIVEKVRAQRWVLRLVPLAVALFFAVV